MKIIDDSLKRENGKVNYDNCIPPKMRRQELNTQLVVMQKHAMNLS